MRVVSNKYIHQPWLADDQTLQQADVHLGDNYPKRIVEHKFAREQALQAYQQIRTMKNK